MANRFWVGGAGTWNATNTTNWSTTSGGAGGASVPGVNDDVFFDANSGSGTVTVGSGTVNCANLDFTGYTQTFNGQFGTPRINIYGSLTVVSGMTWTYTREIYFLATTGSHTITSAGKNLGFWTINTPGATYTLQDNLTLTATGSSTTINFIAGSFDFNDFNVTVQQRFDCLGDGVKVLDMGTGSLTCTGFRAMGTNLTLTTSVGNIVIDSTNRGGELFVTTATFANVTCTGGSTNTTPYRDIFNIQGTISVTGDLTATGSAQRPLTLFGVRGESTINVSGTVALTDVNLHHMTCGGTWSGTRVGDAGGNTGDITFDAPRDLYWIGDGGNWQDNSKWSLTSGGASATTYPLPQDICRLDANSFSVYGQVELNTPFLPSMIWQGVTNFAEFRTNQFNGGLQGFGGWLMVGSTYTLDTTFSRSVNGSAYPRFSTPVGGTMTLTMNGADFDYGYIEINNGEYNGDIGGTIAFADDFNMPNTYLFGYIKNITIPTGVTVSLSDLDLYGSINETTNFNIEGVLSIGRQFLINDSNTVYSEIFFSGDGTVSLGGGVFTYLFMRRQNYVDMKFNFDNSVFSEVFILGDGQTTTIRGVSKNSDNPFNFINHNDKFTIENFTHRGGTLTGYRNNFTQTIEQINIQNGDIRNSTVSDINSFFTITAKNSTDAGGNTNVVFIDVPVNKTANNTLLTNKQANNSGIINKTANPTNLNNV